MHVSYANRGLHASRPVVVDLVKCGLWGTPTDDDSRLCFRSAILTHVPRHSQFRIAIVVASRRTC
jgi:hypothetical protein